MFEGKTVESQRSGFSLEIMANDVDQLDAARHLIPPNTLISITSLPDEELSPRIDAATAVRNLGFSPVPHIAARRLESPEALKHTLDQLRVKAGVTHVFMLAGDVKRPSGPFSDSLDVIRTGILPDFGIQRVTIAGYPEGHPRISDAKLAAALHDKRALLARQNLTCEIMTQFGFDADPIALWIKHLRAEGVTDMIRVGLAGPANMKSLLHFAARCGVRTSKRSLAKYGMSVTKLIGTATPDNLLRNIKSQMDFTDLGPIGVHIYPFGGIHNAASWANEAFAPAI